MVEIVSFGFKQSPYKMAPYVFYGPHKQIGIKTKIIHSHWVSMSSNFQQAGLLSVT